jgi:hypothetical protein
VSKNNDNTVYLTCIYKKNYLNLFLKGITQKTR